VAVGDGGHGYPENAPYDRLIATCSVSSIPPAWIAQTRPGGLVLVNILGGLARIEVRPDRSASGRFLPHGAYFIAMRGYGPARPPLAVLCERVQGHGPRRPVTLPERIADERFWFVAQLALPHVVPVWLPRVVRPGESGPPRSFFESVCLADLADGSWAQTETNEGRGTVIQGGPRRLWDEFEALYDLAAALGFPNRERYGLDITPDGAQRVWLDTPESACAWPLPTLR
jgi:hypothetical protein